MSKYPHYFESNAVNDNDNFSDNFNDSDNDSNNSDFEYDLNEAENILSNCNALRDNNYKNYYNDNDNFIVDWIDNTNLTWNVVMKFSFRSNALLRNTSLRILNCPMMKIPEILEKYTWLNEISFIGTEIDCIKNIPLNVLTLTLSLNKIEQICCDTFTFNEKLCILNLSGNPLKEINFNVFPKTLKELTLSSCGLTNIENSDILNNLEKLDLSVNELSCVPKLNNTLKVLNVSDNKKIVMIEKLPDSLEILKCENCNISFLGELPINLKMLIAYSNSIKQIQTFPPKLLKLDLSHNELENISKFPQGLVNIDVSYNKLTTILLPISAEHVDISNNNIPDHQLDILLKMLPNVTIRSDYEEQCSFAESINRYSSTQNVNKETNIMCSSKNDTNIILNNLKHHNTITNINPHIIKHKKTIKL